MRQRVEDNAFHLKIAPWVIEHTPMVRRQRSLSCSLIRGGSKREGSFNN